MDHGLDRRTFLIASTVLLSPALRRAARAAPTPGPGAGALAGLALETGGALVCEDGRRLGLQRAARGAGSA
jgi:hypothetical protein